MQVKSYNKGENKKIVIIARTIFPSNFPRSFRATELAIEFARIGYDVTLYAVLGKFNYTDFEKKYNVKIKNIGRMLFSTLNSDGEIRNNLIDKILWKLFNRLIEFPDLELMFYMPNILKKESNTDILISVAVPYPIHWGCAFSKVFNKSRFPKIWISDCGDPYMGNKTLRFKPFFYFKYFEHLFLSKTDFVTVPVEEAKSCFYPEYNNKIHVIPQGFRFNLIGKKQYIVNPIPTFAYAGSFYRGHRDPNLFLEFLVKQKIDFKFYIFTGDSSVISVNQQIFGNKVEIRKPLPREELLIFLSQMDFLINFENSTNTQLPSKLIDYALANRPILSISGSEKKFDNFIQFLNKNYIDQYFISNIEQYNIENVVKKFEKLFYYN